MRSSRTWIVALPRFWKQAVGMISDVAGLFLALELSYLLRHEQLYLPASTHEWLLAWVAPVGAAFAVFLGFSLYRSVVRFISLRGLMVMGAGASIASATHALAILLLNDRCPPSVPALFMLLGFVFVAGSRGLFRIWFTHGQRFERERTLVYGAGPSGISLITAFNQSGPFAPVAFIDEDRNMHGAMIHGLYVHPPKELRKLVEDFDVSRIFLAIENMSKSERADVLRRLEPLGVRVQTVPSMADVLAGRARISDLRDIDYDDLLGRDPILPDVSLLKACITGKAVMVTGAGGSIGSELCRQILLLAPRKLIMLDCSEFALYQIDKELRDLAGETVSETLLVPLLGDVLDSQRLETILRLYGVHTVYHAAAYKHVPLVEQNVVEGVRNNVLGTWHAARAAASAGVDVFVLVSTDKAVRPTNIMGASKRAAELVLQGLNEHHGKTRFCMVRFGNVLGSSGSVVPLFREQILRGGPVTVTHPDVIRYFMSIPEAAQLVIQAGAMARGGEVFLLDMGEPVRISELAKRMIHLMGHSVRGANIEGDIDIVYTGLRPGEKLFEELLIGENPEGTPHPRILKANESRLAWQAIESLVTDLEHAINAYDSDRVRELLRQSSTGYRPNGANEDLVGLRARRVRESSEKVLRLPSAGNA